VRRGRKTLRHLNLLGIREKTWEVDRICGTETIKKRQKSGKSGDRLRFRDRSDAVWVGNMLGRDGFGGKRKEYDQKGGTRSGGLVSEL